MDILKTYNQLFETYNNFNISDIVFSENKDNIIISLIYNKEYGNDGSDIFYDILPIGIIIWNEYATYTTLIPEKSLILDSYYEITNKDMYKLVYYYMYRDTGDTINRIKYITNIDISQLPNYKKYTEEIQLNKNIEEFNI